MILNFYCCRDGIQELTKECIAITDQPGIEVGDNRGLTFILDNQLFHHCEH